MPRVRAAEIDALLALRANGKLLVGRERIALLEAVIAHGSITRAAEAAGFSYKTAWDAVNAINNLLPRPAFLTHTGGPKGGGVSVTVEGRRLVAAFRGLEAKLARISAMIATQGLEERDEFVLLSMTMKHSARNAFRCVARDISSGKLSADVALEMADGVEIRAILTNASVAEMGLSPGACVLALVNAASVMLAPHEEDAEGSAASESPGARRNRLAGRVVARFDGDGFAEATVELGAGKTLVSLMSVANADAAGVAAGARVCATFLGADVVLAGD
ncbi:TOBE domain-containing protein [Methylocella sp.]|uniref:TOBE domain-containing protein n=1 Tax=Methylocella sp. TaxID=1978226 RepID=UPI0035B33358